MASDPVLAKMDRVLSTLDTMGSMSSSLHAEAMATQRTVVRSYMALGALIIAISVGGVLWLAVASHG